MALKLTKENLHEFHIRRRNEGNPLSEEECSQLIKGILEGLDYLHHEKNIIHRDIKPGNLLIASYKELTKIKIIDFGLAIQNDKEAISDYYKCGTLLYQPPE